jgi:predicted Zn finger-like uncharacterized protein
VKLHCPGCQTSFSISDDKVPTDKDLKILCPKCRTPVERVESAASTAPPRTASPATSTPTPEFMEDDVDTVSSDVLEEGVKSALLCVTDPARSRRMSQVLEQMDYHLTTASTSKSALDKLQRMQFDMVVLEENHGGTSLSENPVLHHFQFLPMPARREFFLCLLSPTLATLDRMNAFRMGVDLILNERDLDKAKILLMRAMKDQRYFYKTYTEELEKKGQF